MSLYIVKADRLPCPRELLTLRCGVPEPILRRLSVVLPRAKSDVADARPTLEAALRSRVGLGLMIGKTSLLGVCLQGLRSRNDLEERWDTFEAADWLRPN